MREAIAKLYDLSGYTMRDHDFDGVVEALQNGSDHTINDTFIVKGGRVIVEPAKLTAGSIGLMNAAFAANVAIRESDGAQ